MLFYLISELKCAHHILKGIFICEDVVLRDFRDLIFLLTKLEFKTSHFRYMNYVV